MKLTNGMAVFCENKEQANEFLNKCVESKFKWYSGDFIHPFKDAHTMFYKYGTYYFINDNELTRSDCKSSRRDYKYINFKDLFKKESKFKVGDKVRVKNDLVGYKIYGTYGFVPCMSVYKNKIATITKIKGNVISIDLDNGEWNWDEQMLEEVKEDKMSKCKVYEMPEYVGSNIKKVIINEPCVIVILNSGEKGVAKCCPEDKFIEERGYKIAVERAIKEKYLNDVARQDTIINQLIKKFDNEDMIKNHTRILSECPIF